MLSMGTSMSCKCFIDYSNKLYSNSSSSTYTYTATDDCYIMYSSVASKSYSLLINSSSDVALHDNYSSSYYSTFSGMIHKGDVVTVGNGVLLVYGLKY